MVVVQGGLIGRWSRKYGDRRLVFLGLLLLGIGLGLTAVTPQQPHPWYSRTELEVELSGGEGLQPGETPPTTSNIQINLPDDDHNGWWGLLWLMAAMVPTAVGGGVLQPSINSILTKRVSGEEVGGILGISAAFLSGSNAVSPLILGGVFQLFGSTAPFLIGGLILLGLWGAAVRSIK